MTIFKLTLHIGVEKGGDTIRIVRDAARSTGSHLLQTSNPQKSTVLPRVPAACNRVMLTWVMFYALSI